MLEFNQMLDAGVHFGHLKRKWNPKMAPYIFMEKNGIHIIDLHKTAAKVEEASAALKQIAKSGKKVLFVATKKQAKDIVAERVKRTNMPFVTERWPGGMLTISKRERLQITREKAKLEKNLGSIADLTRLPSALFIVDINKEHIAVAEAKRLNIPTFAMVDTNCDPEAVNFAIPANDDASKSIALIIDYVCQAIEEGMQERKLDKDSRMAEQAEEENDRLATELLDDEVSDEKEDNKIRKVKSVAEDTMEKRPRKQISKKGTARK